MKQYLDLLTQQKYIKIAYIHVKLHNLKTYTQNYVSLQF